MFEIELTEQAIVDIKLHRKKGNIKLIKKIDKFIDELKSHPRTGTGKVERLKYFKDREVYSRRIDKKHRLVYEILEDEIIVLLLTVYGHYEL